MENKYYTPELEEFCIGFEYELKLKQEWEKNNFSCELEFEIITTLYRGASNLKNIIQVKQLDREDIESLGFKYDDEIITYKNVIIKNTFCFKSKNNYLIYSFKTNVLSITDKNKKTIVDRILIKNKTELSKLMKQLNIKTQ